MQVSILLILAVAANTAFTDFPRVAALLAKDSFVARQLANLGDRLVFQNGIIVLASVAAIMIILFNGFSHALVPLFAVGAFLAFTLSQAGMIIHWWRLRGPHWQLKSITNGLGSFTTLSALAVIGGSKFFNGAWLTFIFIPLGVYTFLGIRQHYREFDAEMSPPNIEHTPRLGTPMERIVIPVSHINSGIVEAVVLASRLSQSVMAVHVEVNEGSSAALEEEWKQLWPNLELFILPSPYRSVTEPLIKFLEKSDMMNSWEPTAVLLPTYVTEKWWQTALHNQTVWWIRQAIIEEHRSTGLDRKIIEVPYLLRHEQQLGPGGVRDFVALAEKDVAKIDEV
jgi:hypothetical protein